MRRPIALLLVAVLITACNTSAPPPHDGFPRSVGLPPPPAPAASTSQGAATASLADWRGRLERLLPAADITELAGMPPDTTSDTARPDRLRYSWNAGRSQEYAGTRITRKSLVSLGPIRTGNSVEAFTALHFNPPDAQHRARLKDAVTRQAERRNLDEQSTAMAHRLADSFASRDPAQRIEGLGDAAAWATGGGDPTLYVLAGGSTVALVVNVADDPDANRSVAVALARRVLERAIGRAQQ
jgi:hypothetical protein